MADIWKLNINNGIAIKDIEKEIHFHTDRARKLQELQKKLPKSTSLYKFREYLKQRHKREIKTLKQRRQRIKL